MYYNGCFVITSNEKISHDLEFENFINEKKSEMVNVVQQSFNIKNNEIEKIEWHRKNDCIGGKIKYYCSIKAKGGNKNYNGASVILVYENSDLTRLMFAKAKGNDLDIINRFYGEDAKEIYKTLTGIN